MKISSKIFISIMGAAVSTIIVISLFVYFSVSGLLKESIRENQFFSAKHLTEEIDHVISQGLLDIENIALEAPVVHVLGGKELIGEDHYDKDVNEISHMLSNLDTYTGPWHHISIVDKDGKIIFSSDRNQIGKIITDDSANKIAFEKAFSGETFNSDVILNDQNLEPIMIFSAPVYIRDLAEKPIAGAVIGHFMWSNVSFALENHEEFDAYLFNKEGVLIGVSDHKENLLFENHSNNEVVKHALSRQESMAMVTSSFEGGFKTLSTHLESNYKGNRWTLLIEENADKAFAPAKNSAIKIFIFIIPIVILVAAITLLVLRRLIVNPIKKLTQVSEKIANGNLRVEADAESDDELGQLANSFNFMVKKLSEKSKKLLSANKKLKKIDDTKSEFISIASHQLLTPLTVIKGYISMIISGTFGKINSQIQETIVRINSSNERLIDLVGGLLNVSRIESGKMEFDFKESQIEKLLIDLKESFSLIAKNKNLKLSLELPEKGLPAVLMDYMKMQEVISNLIDNSLKYTPKGGVTISAEVEGKFVRVKIFDTGIGFKNEDVVYLFEKFARLKNKEAVQIKGTGLGLYFAKMIMKAHKGNIWAESKGLNKGASFIIEIPIA